MKRIAIVGSGGSGKSTLSVKLGKALNIPVYHLDRLYWNPGWEPTPKQEWIELQKEACQKDTWIIDGNYKSTMDIRLNACDTVIFLDVNRYLCIYRALKRTFLTRHRTDMAGGCEERFDFDFIRFLWGYPSKFRPIVMEKLDAMPEDKRVIIAKSGKQAIQQCLQYQTVDPTKN